ncbi:MAG: thioredoxin domain-containing protein [Acidobacteriaceae bacterium]
MGPQPDNTHATPEHTMNALAHASSSYLRSAMHQPVEWNEWSETVFARAQSENKPILLDIGAVWCHWCHVMDRESYEDPEVAAIINRHFVAIKVDRDERPDVDSRYQTAVAAMSEMGGWPLTVILTPQGNPYFGGTYFPKEDGHGRPGLKRVLLTMADVFRDKQAEVVESAENVRKAVERNESVSGRSGELQPALVEKLVQSALRLFDAQHGGFGPQPKFPHPTVLDLLLDQAMRTGDAGTRKAAQGTLHAMARGGVYDQLAGGFHRYSVDERWTVPHFEKMAYDNSELLKNYLHCFQGYADPEDARVATEIVRWMGRTLSDRVRGGFYASQDADISLDDDGDYFTWTLAEAAAVLTPREMAVAAPYYGIDAVGQMHHNPAKNVLHVGRPLDEVAHQVSINGTEAAQLLASAKEKLFAARLQRPTPYVDTTIYTNWNGLCISAYLEAARVLALGPARQFALQSLDRILREAWQPDGALHHVVASAGGKAPANPVAGMLDDYAMLGHACVDAWESTAEVRYFQQAEALADAMLARFYDATGGGFFDTAAPAPGAVVLGVLGTRRKPLQDAPTPAGNPLAASLLLRLETYNGRKDWREKAQETLEAFAGVVEHFGLYAGAYGLALQRFLLPPVQVCVIGEDAVAGQLAAAAIARYAINKTILRLPRAAIEQRALPPVLAETLPHLPELATPASFAVVCTGSSCQPPVRSAEALAQLLERVV